MCVWQGRQEGAVVGIDAILEEARMAGVKLGDRVQGTAQCGVQSGVWDE